LGAIPESFIDAVSAAKVIGLGEATHGQHECFAFKRQITMHLVREGNCRLVAYETNAPSVRAANEFILGNSNDEVAALRGLGMLIWMVEENRQLLLDLRAWNESASTENQVEIIGIDVQDPDGSAVRFAELTEATFPNLATEARALCDALVSAREAAMKGDRRSIDTSQGQADAFVNQVSNQHDELVRLCGVAVADEA